MGKLITCDNYLGGRHNQGIVWVLCRTKTYFLQALSMAIALPESLERTTKGDRRPSPLQVSDRVMTCHDLLGLQTSKPASHFFLKKKKGGRAVHSMIHLVLCSVIFGKAETVQEYMRKEDK